MAEVQSIVLPENVPFKLQPACRVAMARLATELSLTTKQHAYAELIVAGLNQADAYGLAYSVDPKTSFVSVAASELFRHPKVSLVITEGRATVDHARTLADKTKLERERISTRLAELSESSDSNVALRALKLRGEQAHIQAFSKRPDAESASDVVSALDMLAQITENAREQLGYIGPIIDVQPVQSLGNLQGADSTRTVLTLVHPLVELPDWCLPGAD